MNDRIAIDSQILTYFIQSAEPGYNPLNDSQGELAEEREAIFHIFMRADILYVPPIVKKEYMRISDNDIRQSHERFNDVHFADIKDLNKTNVEDLKSRLIHTFQV